MSIFKNTYCKHLPGVLDSKKRSVGCIHKVMLEGLKLRREKGKEREISVTIGYAFAQMSLVIFVLQRSCCLNNCRMRACS